MDMSESSVAADRGHAPTRDGKANLGVRHSAINSSYIATADSVEQSEKYIKVGSSGCSTFGLQRCDFGSA